MTPFEIIKTARLTEKGTIQTEKYNQYTFIVDRRANKIQIRKAIEELFNVKVIKVRTMNVRGKRRRKGLPSEGRTSDWKKAIVTLKEGDRIVLT